MSRHDESTDGVGTSGSREAMRSRGSLLWLVALVGLALLLATCTGRRTQKPPRSLSTTDSDGSAKAEKPAPPSKPKHGPHDHAHGAHPHKRDAHHHHAHPHPHVEGADGHHHPN